MLIPATGEGAPHLKIEANIAASTVTMMRHLRADSRLWWGALVISWFWLIGIVVLSLLPPLIKTLIGGNEQTITAYLAIFSIAVGVGSGVAAATARGRIVLGTTLVGVVLLGAFALDLGFATFGLIRQTRRKVLPLYSHHRSGSAPRSTYAGLQSRAACSSCRPLPRCSPGAAQIVARAPSPRSTFSTRLS